MDVVMDEGVDCDCEDGTDKFTVDTAAAEDATDDLLNRAREDRLTGAERALGAVGSLVGEECGVLAGEECGVLTGEVCGVITGEDCGVLRGEVCAVLAGED